MALVCCYAACQYAECHYAECRGAELELAKPFFAILKVIKMHYFTSYINLFITVTETSDSSFFYDFVVKKVSLAWSLFESLHNTTDPRSKFFGRLLY